MLRIPEWNRVSGYRVYGDEILLISLERCALAQRLLDLQEKYHIPYHLCGSIVSWFAEFMQTNWIYLLRANSAANGLNGMSHLEKSANAIRDKLIFFYDQEINPVGPDGWRIFDFIDCTITKTCRIGGGPMTAGQLAVRFPGIVFCSIILYGFVLLLEI